MEMAEPLKKKRITWLHLILDENLLSPLQSCDWNQANNHKYNCFLLLLTYSAKGQTFLTPWSSVQVQNVWKFVAFQLFMIEISGFHYNNIP